MTVGSISANPGQEQTPILLNAYKNARTVPLWEQAAVSLWFLITYINLPGVTPVRYLMVAAFIAYFGMYYRTMIPMVLKCWPLFLLPIFGAFSFLWSDYSSPAVRAGLLYLMTPFIITVIAARMELRIILRCFFFAGAIATLYTLQFWGTYPGGGPYASKNYLALHMTFALFFALIMALSTKESGWLRAMAAPFVPVCLVIVVLSNSATATILATVGTFGLIVVRYFWLSITRMRHLRSVVMLSGFCLAMLGVAIVVSLPSNTFVNDFLAMMGKDSTLTGRTAIWDAGRMVAEENPVIGVGLEGFWQYDVGTAQTINENDHKPFGTKLSFHNAYLEVRVHLGMVGYGLFLLIIGWCLTRTSYVWLRDPSMEHSAMLVITAIIFVSTFTESWLWLPLNSLTSLFYLGAISSLGTGHRQYLGKVPAVIHHN